MLWDRLWAMLWDRLFDRLWNRLWGRLWGRLCERLWDRLSTTHYYISWGSFVAQSPQPETILYFMFGFPGFGGMLRNKALSCGAL